MREKEYVENFGEEISSEKPIWKTQMDSMKMDVNLIRCEDDRLIELAQDGNQWWGLVITV
jgi:hypothetical protein